MRSDRIPFFSRLGVKQAAVMTLVVMLAMTTLTVLQLRETLTEAEASAVDKGRALSSAIAPLISDKTSRPLLKEYFNNIVSAKTNIDYVQVVDADGHVQLSSNLALTTRNPNLLSAGWALNFENKAKLDRKATAVPWNEGGGVDVFICLLHDSEIAESDSVQKALHLRIGVNFDEIVRLQLPRVLWHMALFTLVAAAILIVGMLMLVDYLLRPLRELHRGLQAVAAGNLEYQVPVYTRDEVGRVATAFNATIARLHAAFKQIEQLATHDSLTMLPNRRLFDVKLAAEAARSRRYGHPFGLIIMDLDKFKEVNDRYGHPAGDEVLKAVARTIEASMRETDMPARIGGEEFAALLPETEPHDVIAVAEKLRAAVAECRLPQREGLPAGLRITLSAGVACSSSRLITPETVMAAADAALYKSKGEGRNRVTLAESTEVPAT